MQNLLINQQIEMINNRKTKYSQFDNLVYGYTMLELGQNPGLCGSRGKWSSLSGSHGWTKNHFEEKD